MQTGRRGVADSIVGWGGIEIKWRAWLQNILPCHPLFHTHKQKSKTVYYRETRKYYARKLTDIYRQNTLHSMTQYEKYIMWLQLETGTPNLAIVSSHTYKLTHGRLVHPQK